jgi:hypothetical protein
MDVPPKYGSHKAEGWLLLTGAAVLMLVLFVKLFITLTPKLTRANEALKTGRAIKLEAGINKDSLKKIISGGNYFTDDRDMEQLVDSLSMRLITAGGIDNLGAINKNAFGLAAPLEWKATTGGVDFQGRLEASPSGHVLRPLGEESQMTAAQLAALATDPAGEDESVRCWRFDELVRAGYEEDGQIGEGRRCPGQHLSPVKVVEGRDMRDPTRSRPRLADNFDEIQGDRTYTDDRERGPSPARPRGDGKTGGANGP